MISMILYHCRKQEFPFSASKWTWRTSKTKRKQENKRKRDEIKDIPRFTWVTYGNLTSPV